MQFTALEERKGGTTMMVSLTNTLAAGLSSSSVARFSGGTQTPLMPTEVTPAGRVLLTRESPNPPLHSRPLPLPLSYYIRIAAEHRLLKQALAGIRLKRPG
jgi:hypothetical protein